MLPIESSLVGPVAETHDCSTSARSRSSPRPCSRSATASPARRRSRSRTSASCARTRRRSTSAATCSRDAACDGRLRCRRPPRPRTRRPRTATRRTWRSSARKRSSLYGLTLLADDIGDHTAFTRFVSIGRTPRSTRRTTARTAFSFVTRHQPGALHAAIEPFARVGLDLQRLVSRPQPATPWKYRFDAVVAGHPLEPAVRASTARSQGRHARAARCRRLRRPRGGRMRHHRD